MAAYVPPLPRMRGGGLGSGPSVARDSGSAATTDLAALGPDPSPPPATPGEGARRRGLPSTLVLALLLGGCAPTLATVRPAKLDQPDFLGTVAREERRHAIFLGRQGVTIREAERFAWKAEAARSGRLPELEPASGPAMSAARERLVRLIETPARDRCPVFAGVAFARYDAWAERERAWPGGEDALRYRKETEENLAALGGFCVEGPAPRVS